MNVIKGEGQIERKYGDFSNEFKVRVVSEALRERVTIQELGQKYDLDSIKS